MSTFARILGGLAVALVLLLAGGGLIWYLAYEINQGPPERLALFAVNDTVRIAWGTQGDATIEAARMDDAISALGYIHGRHHAWSVVLWRQAALGQLGAWFGQTALPLDRLARHLGLADLARTSYAHLDEQDRAFLQAYTAGLNAALLSPDILIEQEFVLLDVQPEPWQPWHTLALERLFSWLASPPPSPERLRTAGSDVQAFYKADRRLREWLHLHGFENSLAWAVRDSAGTLVFQRHVYGATALPFLQEVAVFVPDSTTLWGASLPGTPFFPSGKTDGTSWTLFLKGTALLDARPWQPDSATLHYERIQSNDDTEYLTTFWREPHRLTFPTPETSPADTVESIRWNGFLPTSDCAAWRGLWSGRLQPFTLLEGNGLRVDRTGAWSILGTPAVAVSIPSGIFVGTTPWSRYAAEFLRTQQADPVRPEAWIDDAYSIWAAQTAPPLVGVVGAAPEAPPALRDALTYLRNWDYTYDRASIAASIFDYWVTSYLATTGALPDTTQVDSATGTAGVFYQALTRAVDTLTVVFGPDQRQWRWERVNPDRRYFPVWSVDSLRATGRRLGAGARFDAIEWPGHGHPSAPAWGSSPTQRAPAAPASWEAWHRTDRWETTTIRRLRLDPRIPLGRYLATERSPAPVALPSPPPYKATTLLIPSRD